MLTKKKVSIYGASGEKGWQRRKKGNENKRIKSQKTLEHNSHRIPSLGKSPMNPVLGQGDCSVAKVLAEPGMRIPQNPCNYQVGLVIHLFISASESRDWNLRAKVAVLGSSRFAWDPASVNKVEEWWRLIPTINLSLDMHIHPCEPNTWTCIHKCMPQVHRWTKKKTQLDSLLYISMHCPLQLSSGTRWQWTTAERSLTLCLGRDLSWDGAFTF